MLVTHVLMTMFTNGFLFYCRFDAESFMMFRFYFYVNGVWIGLENQFGFGRLRRVRRLGTCNEIGSVGR